MTALMGVGLHIPDVPRMCTYLVAAMSVGFTCSVLVERYGGDVPLSAQAVFYSTFCSLFTAPAILMVVQRLGL
jgi:predicted permease